VSVTPGGLDGRRPWSARVSRWLIVAVHVAVIAPYAVADVGGMPGRPPASHAWVALPLLLAVLALQLRHSLAIARGERPAGAAWTLLALLVIVYAPLAWFGWRWAGLQACLMASSPVVLRRWRMIGAVATPVLGTDLAVLVTLAGQPLGTDVHHVLYWTVSLPAQAAALYGSARLVRLIDELRETRAELAALAVGRERLRASRDPHDLLGQSLSAVSLKGDLAIRLLRSDPPAALAEVESLTGLAREALRGVRAASHDEHAVSLRTEIEGAAALLSAADIDARIRLDLPGLAPPTERMLAWAVREGVANTLRHSQARTCWMTAGRRHQAVFLEIVNDGALRPAGEGGGLAVLAERARALSGSVSAGHLSGGRFRLLVEVPEPE
jgi:two-component system sensor histidine kinase DesK